MSLEGNAEPLPDLSYLMIKLNNPSVWVIFYVIIEDMRKLNITNEERKLRKKQLDKEYRLKNRAKLSSQIKLWCKKNPEKVKEYRRKYNHKDVEGMRLYKREYARKWAKENRERLLKNAKKHYYKNRQRILKKLKENRKDPYFRINDSISSLVYISLKKNKGGKTWQKILGFSMIDLVAHLEKNFTPEMNWQNYGSYWHIDHKIPISWFKFTSVKDDEFKKCWALENLQPLEASLNIKKGNRYST